MNYDLALKLKNAGFPQKEWPGTKLYDHSQEEWIDGKAQGIIDNEGAYSPTLSELIEACGDIWIDIYNLENDHGHWVADRRDAVPMTPFNAHGSTPEEAVANLYIVLHSNEN